jgi:hypothetical protein
VCACMHVKMLVLCVFISRRAQAARHTHHSICSILTLIQQIKKMLYMGPQDVRRKRHAYHSSGIRTAGQHFQGVPPGTQITCFTGTKLQILTKLASIFKENRKVIRLLALLVQKYKY